MKKLEGIFWVGVGAGICALALGTELVLQAGPAPGFLAFLTGIFIAVMGVVVALSAFFSKAPGDAPETKRSFKDIAWTRIVYTMAFLVIYYFLLDPLGYVLTTFIVMSGLFYDRGTNRLSVSVLVSLITTIATYFVFDTLLHSQLPRGIVPWW